GLLHLMDVVAELDETFVAILDDDDAWAPEYLERCLAVAGQRDLVMVAADILRIEQPPGVVNRAPETLHAADFLVGNPHIQGSSLFVRLDRLLAAGLFDEALISSTDRDLCLRLCALPDLRYGRLDQALVHHFAEPDRDRLSTAGSPAKLAGLSRFWQKWSGRMTPEQQARFRERAHCLFAWDDPSEVVSDSRPSRHPQRAEGAVALVVGFIADAADEAVWRPLVDDLATLAEDQRIAGLDVVIVENAAGPPGPLDAAAESLRKRGVGCFIATRDDQRQHAAAAFFGPDFVRAEGRASIAAARTMLQLYTYALCRRRRGAVAWLLDADMRLDALVDRAGERVTREPLDVATVALRLREAGVDVAIGETTGAPPLPFASCVRTQLVDAWHNLCWFASQAPDHALPDRSTWNARERTRCRDYYYDLSRAHTDHLESPFWWEGEGTVRDELIALASRLPRLLAGEHVTRPLVLNGDLDPLDHMKPSVHRGGNALVFDHEALRDFPNPALQLGGRETRRSDMIWSLLNTRTARRRVVKVPFGVRQDRSAQAPRLDLDKLVRDIQGFALCAALADLLDETGLEGIDLGALAERVNDHLRQRFTSFEASFHRIAGVLGSLLRLLDEGHWWQEDLDAASAVRRLRDFLQQLDEAYQCRHLQTMRDEVFSIERADLAAFLSQLRRSVTARAELPLEVVDPWVRRNRVDNARALIGCADARVLGVGAEGVALTDGQQVFKLIDYWKTVESAAKQQFLRGQIGAWDGLPGLCSLSGVRRLGSRVIVRYPYEPSEPYTGGRAAEMTRLLHSCRTAGIVCHNLHPDNLRVAARGIVLVDYGSDIHPYTDADFDLMVRRAWLSIHHAGRSDLKLLMHRSLHQGDLPELQGYRALLEASTAVTKEQVLDAHLLTALGGSEGRHALDYGCGKGKLAEALTSRGWQVTAYDPVPAWSGRWPESTVSYLEHAPARGSYAAVVCSLVLCILEEGECRRVLAALRQLVAEQGRVYLAICNPHHINGVTSLQARLPPPGKTPADIFVLRKRMAGTHNERLDIHRPLAFYESAIHQAGFIVDSVHETPAVDLETWQASSDFMVFTLVPGTIREEAR
ncbi:MAG: methyltransferase domain-containing protein, partial [Oligoflexia bacterium]|nr:methyltransferase domain-containing protein [Oligoflexia bacterium]